MTPIQYDYIQLIKLLENFASEHLMIQRFASDFEEQLNNLCTTGNTYPFMFVAPVNGVVGTNTSTYTFKVFVLDQLQKDRSNVDYILNDSSFILNNLKVYLSEENDDVPVLSMNDPSIIPLNNFGVDYLAGHYAEFEVEFDTPVLCDIPFENTPVISGFTCDINYTNNALTCSDLETCPIIETIQEDITELQDEVNILNTIVLAQNQLLSGGASFLSGLTYSITPLTYIINGAFYSAVTSTVTVASGDTTFDRIDIIVADISGNTSVVQGTPSTNPVSPDINEITQVEVALITVAAGSTSTATPSTLVYNEKIGPPTEWTFATTFSPSISGDSTTVAYSGTVAIELSAATTARFFTLSSSTVFDSTTQNTIQFAIKNRIAWPGAVGATRLRFGIYSSAGVQIGTNVDLYNGRFGFSSSSTAWQLLSIPLSDFALTTTLFSTIRVTTVNTGGLAINTSMDVFKMIVGTPSTTSSPSWLSFRDNAGTTVPALVTNDTFTISGASGIGTQMVGPRTIRITYTGSTTSGGGSGFSGWTGSTGYQSIKANNDSPTLASGPYSVAEGYNTTASGVQGGAHAEGYHTIAGGPYGSHSEGLDTQAQGQSSHAEGVSTTATGTACHSEGSQTYAYTDYSHAEGRNTTSYGYASHTEGSGTTAGNVILGILYGTASHAEGAYTTASGHTSHSEGSGTTALGLISHAEGFKTTAGGNRSHSEGNQTTTLGIDSHAEGNGTIASGETSHAQGYQTQANGIANNAEGYQTTAAGDYGSHTEGYATTTTGDSSHAEGDTTIASGYASHSEGGGTLASGNYSHAENSQTIASGDYAHAEGFQTTAVGFDAHSEGQVTTASGQASHSEGQFTISSGIASHSEGGNTTAIGTYSHAGGVQTIASGYTSFVHGSGSTANGINTVVFGANITGNTDNTVYVPYLNINKIYPATLVYGLGIDALGNVVTGTTSAGGGSGISAFTYDNANRFTIIDSTGGTYSVIANIMTGLTVTGLMSANTVNIASAMTYTDGNQLAGKVLTSDANGNATWEFPSTTSINTYMFTTANSDIGGYEQMVSLNVYVSGSVGTTATTITTTPKIIGVFATNSGYPNLTVIPTGVARVHFDSQKTAGSNNYYTYAEIYKRSTGGTETLLATTDLSTQTSVNTVVQQDIAAIISSAITLTTTDRIVVKIYGVMVSSTATLTLRYDDATSARLELPATLIDSTNFVPYTGATSDVNLNSKNLTNVNTILTNTITATTYYNVPDAIGIVYDGQGGVISTGNTSYRVMGYAGRISGWDIVATTTGATTIDVWKIASGSTLPTVANSIVGSEIPTLSSGFINSDTNLTTWTSTSFNAGDIFAFHVNTASVVTRVSLSLRILKQ